MADVKKTETTCAAIAGHQAPELDEETLAFEQKVRAVVRKRIQEVVRKKPGGGGYILYSPNQGKKKAPKPVGEFPTKLAARKAELARFPPKDADKLRRARKNLERMAKDPKKRARAVARDARSERPDGAGQPRPSRSKGRRPKEEGVLRSIVRSALAESLFMEEPTESRWEERISQLPQEAVESDRRLQRLVKSVADAQSAYLSQIAQRLITGLRKAGVKGKGSAVALKERTPYVRVTMECDGTALGAVHIYLDAAGTARLEVTAEYKTGLTRIEPDEAKAVRGTLSAFQDEVQEERTENPVVAAIGARDKYLDALEKKVDGFVSKLDPLGVSLAKGLLIRKYRSR